MLGQGNIFQKRVSRILFTGGIPACIASGIPPYLADLAEGGSGIPACLAGLQAHTRGELRGLAWVGGISRPTPRGKLRGLALGVSRPKPRGGVEGSGLGRSPGPHPGGLSPGPHPGGSPGPHLGGLQAHTQGGCLQAHTQGVSRSTPTGGIPACTEADTPSRRLLLRAVRILLECILVLIISEQNYRRLAKNCS